MEWAVPGAGRCLLGRAEQTAGQCIARGQQKKQTFGVRLRAAETALRLFRPKKNRGPVGRNKRRAVPATQQ
jgi:hypothetical protein